MAQTVEMHIGAKSFFIELNGNDAARDFASRLPMELQFEDFAGTERIAYLNPKLNVGEAPVKSLQLSVSNALGESLTNWILTGEIKANEEFILEGAFSEWCDPLSVYTYPISVNNLRFNMGTSTKGQQYEIRVLGLDAIYDGYDAVTSVEADNNRVRIWPNPVAGGETVRVEADGKATVMVYGMNGAMVAETTIDGVGEISTAGLAQGVYIVKVMADSNVKTAKLIVK